MSEASRQLARQIFAEALAATTVEAACARHLRVEDNILHVAGPAHDLSCDLSYDLRCFASVQIVSIGKAGATLFDAVRNLLPDTPTVRSVVSAPAPPLRLAVGRAAGKAAGSAAGKVEEAQYFRGGHPLPNADSLAAAAAALAMLATADETTLVLFLISGGASAMFEQPLSPALGLDGLIELNRQLVGSGATIRQMNAVRKRLSAVKGGRLAAAAPAATKLSLLVSDVPAGALDSLASGPTLPDSTTLNDALAIFPAVADPDPEPAMDEASAERTMRQPQKHRNLHHSFRQFLEETPKSSHPAFRNAHHVVLLDNDALLAAAAAAARRLGFEVVLDNTCDDWDYEAAAAYLLQQAAALKPNACLISGGEVTVRLPLAPGVGGRNQQFALRAARDLEASSGLTLLSAGSDGIDGNSPAAGAVVDATTWPRARRLGLDPEAHLADFNAFPLFEALGDALLPGPTGNNLRDLRVFLRTA